MKLIIFVALATALYAENKEPKLRKEYLRLVNETEILDAKKSKVVTKWLALCKSQDKVLEGKPSGAPGCVPPRIPAPQPPPPPTPAPAK